MLSTAEIRATGAWIVSHQDPSGAIPWWRGGKMDPWDHVHAAMGLTVAGFRSEAEAAYRFLATAQLADGGWYAERRNGAITDRTQETNHAAYFCTGLWHHYTATRDRRLLTDLWPTVERAMDFTLRLQDESGAISWAVSPEGAVWNAPLLTGSSSIHGSITCAVRIAESVGAPRPRWLLAQRRLANVLANYIQRFDNVDLAERPGRYSMDWYYPVLAGAIRGKAARARLSDQASNEKFVTEGIGCRCVHDSPWYTVAESCELVLALNACGLTGRARELLGWMAAYRMNDGGYHTGKTWPENVVWPVECNTWTAATVLLADDALAGRSRASELFQNLDGSLLAERAA
jgi:hypothetical protein